MTYSKKHLFEIPNLMKGIFISRPNRFVGEIKYNRTIKTAHIHDPGRLKELLFKGGDTTQGIPGYDLVIIISLISMSSFFLLNRIRYSKKNKFKVK